MDQPPSVRQQLRLLELHRRTLAHYLEQRAIIGTAFLQPSVAHGIREAREEIQRIKKMLRSKNVPVEDDPNDEEIGNLSQGSPVALPDSTDEVNQLALIVEKHHGMLKRTAISDPLGIEFYFSLKNISKQQLVIYDLGLQKVSALYIERPASLWTSHRVELSASIGRIGQDSQKISLHYTHLPPLMLHTVDKFEKPKFHEQQLSFQSVISKDLVIVLSPTESESFLLTLTADSGASTVSTTFTICALYHDESGQTGIAASKYSYFVQISDHEASIDAAMTNPL